MDITGEDTIHENKGLLNTHTLLNYKCVGHIPNQNSHTPPHSVRIQSSPALLNDRKKGGGPIYL